MTKNAKQLLCISVAALFVVPAYPIVMSELAARQWLASGHPHPIYEMTTYGPLFPWHRDSMSANLERSIARLEAAKRPPTPSTRGERDDYIERLKLRLACLRAGNAFYTEDGGVGTMPMRASVRPGVRLMFDGSENPVPPVSGRAARWAKLFNKIVRVNIVVPY